MAVLWDVVFLAFIDEMLRNFLWVPLTSYCKELHLSVSFLGTLFAMNVGARFFPNFLVTFMGAKAEWPMMMSVFAGFAISYQYPEEQWALQALALLAGMGFVRGCVTLHSQALCGGDVDALSDAARHCGAARSLADIMSYTLPAALYDYVGFSGVTLLGGTLALLYLAASVPVHLRTCRLSDWPQDDEEEVEASRAVRKESLVESPEASKSIPWIDWALAGAFVSTELQWNLLNSSFPAGLVHRFGYPTAAIGSIVGGGCACTLGYLLILPRLPAIFNRRRPVNLLLSYFGMAVAWLVMLLAVVPFNNSILFILGSFIFLSQGTTSQIVMLECLTGVSTLETSSKIMGISEMVGCGFGMVGSYAGEALLKLGLPAPFICCGIVSFLSWATLAHCLGRRRHEIALDASCHTTNSPMMDSMLPMSLVRSAKGFMDLFEREDSYIGIELAHRGDAGGPADVRLSENDQCPMLKSRDDLETGVRGRSYSGGASNYSGHWASDHSVDDEHGGSTARGRRMKRLAAGFEYAFPELDATDHESAHHRHPHRSFSHPSSSSPTAKTCEGAGACSSNNGSNNNNNNSNDNFHNSSSAPTDPPAAAVVIATASTAAASSSSSSPSSRSQTAWTAGKRREEEAAAAEVKEAREVKTRGPREEEEEQDEREEEGLRGGAARPLLAGQ